MGLLNMQQPQPAQQGGLLGGMPQQGGEGMKLAVMLSNTPTPEMANQIIAKLRAANNPEADQFEKFISSANGDPQKLKILADKVIEIIGGKNG